MASIEKQGKAPKALAGHVANAVWGSDLASRFCPFASGPYQMELGNPCSGDKSFTLPRVIFEGDSHWHVETRSALCALNDTVSAKQRKAINSLRKENESHAVKFLDDYEFNFEDKKGNFFDIKETVPPLMTVQAALSYAVSLDMTPLAGVPTTPPPMQRY